MSENAISESETHSMMQRRFIVDVRRVLYDQRRIVGGALDCHPIVITCVENLADKGEVMIVARVVLAYERNDTLDDAK